MLLALIMDFLAFFTHKKTTGGLPVVQVQRVYSMLPDPDQFFSVANLHKLPVQLIMIEKWQNKYTDTGTSEQ